MAPRCPPGNILLTEDGRVKLLDFGLAHFLGTRGLQGAGTPAYMAPEQARVERATAASDWYAVGVMLFEALTGRLPFEGDSLQLLMAKQTGTTPDVLALEPSAPADLAALCPRLLKRDPALRPTPSEIHAALGGVIIQ